MGGNIVFANRLHPTYFVFNTGFYSHTAMDILCFTAKPRLRNNCVLKADIYISVNSNNILYNFVTFN